MTEAMILIALLLIGSALWDLVRGDPAPITGHNAGIQDGSPPRDWLRIVGGLALGGTVLADAYIGETTGDLSHIPTHELLLAATMIALAVRALRSGHALDTSFSRTHEPRQYWGLVAILFGAAFILFWFAVLTI